VSLSELHLKIAHIAVYPLKVNLLLFDSSHGPVPFSDNGRKSAAHLSMVHLASLPKEEIIAAKAKVEVVHVLHYSYGRNNAVPLL
jgi:hypothetical protein